MKQSSATDQLSILSNASLKDGVYYLSPTNAFQGFEAAYLKIREKEGRFYPKKTINLLPHTLTNHPYHKEWQTRLPITLQFLNHLTQQKTDQLILEVGCGNGWLSARMAQNISGQVIALDINEPELKEGATTFQHITNLHFVFADILEKNIFPEATFTTIVIAGAIQYFSDFHHTINTLLGLLKPKGQIHIFDSPFYNQSQKKAAQERSRSYFQEMGVDEMSTNFHHHLSKVLTTYKHTKLYNPSNIRHRIHIRRKSIPTNPFPWICIYK